MSTHNKLLGKILLAFGNEDPEQVLKFLGKIAPLTLSPEQQYSYYLLQAIAYYKLKDEKKIYDSFAQAIKVYADYHNKRKDQHARTEAVMAAKLDLISYFIEKKLNRLADKIFYYLSHQEKAYCKTALLDYYLSKRRKPDLAKKISSLGWKN